MYDDPGFISLSIVSLVAVCASFTGLVWAAIHDGRDERAFRARS